MVQKVRNHLGIVKFILFTKLILVIIVAMCIYSVASDTFGRTTTLDEYQNSIMNLEVPDSDTVMDKVDATGQQKTANIMNYTAQQYSDAKDKYESFSEEVSETIQASREHGTSLKSNYENISNQVLQESASSEN